MEISPGIYENISNDVYHKNQEWLSSSQIKVALQSAHHFKWFVKDGRGQKESNQSKSFGSLVHKLILEPETFNDEYAVFDMSLLDLRRTHDREVLAKFKADHPGKIVVSAEDMEKAEICRESVMKHPDAKRLLELPGKSEVSCYAELEHKLPTGEVVLMKVRVRPDRLSLGNAIIDLKTTKSASKESFTKDALAPWGYGYDVSAALYVRVIAKLTGEIHPFIFVAVHNDQPFETAVYKLGQESMTRGEAKLDRALTTIVLAERAGRWEYQKEMEEI